MSVSQLTPTPNGSTPSGSTPSGSTPSGSSPNGSALNGSPLNGSALNGSPLNGSAPNGSTRSAYPLTNTALGGERAANKWPVSHAILPSQRRFSTNRRRNIAPDMLRRQVVGMINDGTVSIEGGNALLKSFNLPPLKSDGQVTFRVNARVRASYNGLSGTIEHARLTIADELCRLRWTTFDGCPEGFGIDEPVLPEGPYGRRYGTVQTTLRLTVTVPAYEDGLLEKTALDLLFQDLGRLCQVQPVLTRVTPWLDEPMTDSRLEPGYVDDDIRLIYADCGWAEIDGFDSADDIAVSVSLGYNRSDVGAQHSSL
jgi:hypothetical protein